jgi:four helix bundle suffix protein
VREDGKYGNNGKNESHGKNSSHDSDLPERVLPPRGDYRTLLGFQKAEVVYDITFRFTHKFLSSRGDRTVDQMIQAARSGKKNILEGSKAAPTSTETELKLTNVARVRELPLWDKNSKEALYVRNLGRKKPQTYECYREFVETRPPEVVANIALCLIHQANYLIDRQLLRLEADFIKNGGLRERMMRIRLEYRNKHQISPDSYKSHKPLDSTTKGKILDTRT